jgi:hypothetical protein
MQRPQRFEATRDEHRAHLLPAPLFALRLRAQERTEAPARDPRIPRGPLE